MLWLDEEWLCVCVCVCVCVYTIMHWCIYIGACRSLHLTIISISWNVVVSRTVPKATDVNHPWVVSGLFCITMLRGQVITRCTWAPAALASATTKIAAQHKARPSKNFIFYTCMVGSSTIACFLLSDANLNYWRAGNFRGRKLSRISRFFSHPRSFLRAFHTHYATSFNIPRNTPIRERFLPLKFPAIRYSER